jgi:hypothetical protein
MLGISRFPRASSHLGHHIKGAIPADIMGLAMKRLGLPQAAEGNERSTSVVFAKLARCLPDISA